MPKNANAEAALNYHEATKHSYTSVRTNPHFLDFANQPLPFKIYPALEPSRMPTEVRQTGVAALSAIVHAPITIGCTCTYWRNAWTYQARTYRHFGWDNGTLLANLLAVATALGLPAKVVCGFVDATVNRLLDVDSQREVAFSLVALGHDSGPSAPTATQDISPLGFETVPLSRDEIDYPLMREMH